MKIRVEQSNDLLYNLLNKYMRKGISLKTKSWGGYRQGAGRTPLTESEKKQGAKIYLTVSVKEDIINYGIGDNFSEKATELIYSEIKRRKNTKKN